MEEKFIYNSLKLGEELKIAGKFLDIGIKELKSYDKMLLNHELFYIMYNFSVGIERLQKVLILLNYNDTSKIKKIKHHSHGALQHKINQTTKLKLETKENKMLSLLDKFYNNYRYETIEDNNKLDSVIELLREKGYYDKNNNFKKSEFITSIIKLISIYIKKLKKSKENCKYILQKQKLVIA